ncbi:hypothetical protein [Nonomuraea jiangxiensis]|uniref:hypothetical protein n=1 Tax=Nonomuraea jiangxiensis TaxID=633440 RepID=UPI001FE8771C|nr:hypothetical protein [Nonomuraea jiangxiensis]
MTDSGDAHEERGLKRRGGQDVRPVPIPPELVKILREHIAEFGTAGGPSLLRGRVGPAVVPRRLPGGWTAAHVRR